MVESKDTLNSIFTDGLHRMTNTVKTIMYFQGLYKNRHFCSAVISEM